MNVLLLSWGHWKPLCVIVHIMFWAACVSCRNAEKKKTACTYIRVCFFVVFLNVVLCDTVSMQIIQWPLTFNWSLMWLGDRGGVTWKANTLSLCFRFWLWLKKHLYVTVKTWSIEDLKSYTLRLSSGHAWTSCQHTSCLGPSIRKCGACLIRQR